MIIPSCTECGLCCISGVILYKNIDEGKVPDSMIDFMDHPLLFGKMKGSRTDMCLAWDRDTKLCSIYENRPKVCREFERGSDLCIMILNRNTYVN